MPEMPEIETIKRDLSDSLLGARFLNIEVLYNKIVQGNKNYFISSLLNHKISQIKRRGKLLIIALEKSDNYLLLHLKMTGQLILVEQNKLTVGGHSTNNHSLEKEIGGPLPNKYTRIVFTFNRKKILYFNDLRKFAYVKIVNQIELDNLLTKNYGPEPLEKELSSTYLQSMLQQRTTSIKAVLLNQKIIAGLGNIYVDEVLFQASIRPDRQAKSLQIEEIKKLRQAINQVIKKAIYYRGTTFSNYRDGSGRQGNFSQFLQVYGRKDEACLNCQTMIKKIKLAGRGTHFCPHCQK